MMSDVWGVTELHHALCTITNNFWSLVWNWVASRRLRKDDTVFEVRIKCLPKVILQSHFYFIF